MALSAGRLPFPRLMLGSATLESSVLSNLVRLSIPETIFILVSYHFFSKYVRIFSIFLDVDMLCKFFEVYRAYIGFFSCKCCCFFLFHFSKVEAEVGIFIIMYARFWKLLNKVINRSIHKTNFKSFSLLFLWTIIFYAESLKQIISSFYRHSRQNALKHTVQKNIKDQI